jgi:hypothetical protein
MFDKTIRPKKCAFEKCGRSEKNFRLQKQFDERNEEEVPMEWKTREILFELKNPPPAPKNGHGIEFDERYIWD